MNPMTNVKNIKKLSEQDIKLGGKSSWHDQYKDSAWIFIGGLPYDLTEGDVICVFSQYGEVVHINLVRDKDTGKQKGFCFLCYEDQRSTILAVDNLNATKILGRTLRVDHVENYKAPQEGKKKPIDDETRLLREQGCAPVAVASEPSLPPTQIKQETIKLEPMIVGGVKLPPRLPIGPSRDDARPSAVKVKKEKKESKKKRDKEEKAKKSKKEKKSKKRKRKHSTSSSDSSSSSSSSESDSSEEDDRKTHRKKKR